MRKATQFMFGWRTILTAALLGGALFGMAAEPPPAGSRFTVGDLTGGGLKLEECFSQVFAEKAVAMPENIELAIRPVADLAQAWATGCSAAAGDLPEHFTGQAIKTLTFARVPAVIAVPVTRSLDNLTAEQVRAIFTGRLTDWSSLQQGSGAIRRAGVDLNSPSGRAFRRSFMRQTLLPGENPAPGSDLLPDVIECPTPEAAEALAAAFPEIIIFGSLALAGSPRLKLLKIDGVAPDQKNLRSGAYRWFLDQKLIYRTHTHPAHLPDIAAFFGACAVRYGALNLSEQSGK